MIDVHLDDLQSSLEASTRAIEKMQGGLAVLQSALMNNPHHAGLMTQLVRDVAGLKASISQQRETLYELRVEVQKIRDVPGRPKSRL